MQGPHFLVYLKPLVDILKDNGGKGTTSDIIDQVIEKMNVSEEELNETISTGASKVRNQIQWARMYLAKVGMMDSSERGVWKLTEKGYQTDLDDSTVYEIFKQVQKTYRKKSVKKVPKDESVEIENTIVEDESHGEVIIKLLKELSPAGFEKICKRLLTEIGIHDVQVTGRSGDQGIDGIGLIKINDVVGFTIIFQCKRVKDTVSPHHVRDFRGTMQGRADKGLIITTGRFTAESKREAIRDGVPPIELIDGERLVSLFEKYELGLKPKSVYDVDLSFFEKYK
jgi:restriction system protein